MSVREYFNKLEEKAAVIGKTDAEIRGIAMSGLNPELRDRVICHDVNRLEDLRRWAGVCEDNMVKSAAPQHQPTSSDVNVTESNQMAELIKVVVDLQKSRKQELTEIKQGIKNQLDQVQLRAIEGESGDDDGQGAQASRRNGRSNYRGGRQNYRRINDRSYIKANYSRSNNYFRNNVRSDKIDSEQPSTGTELVPYNSRVAKERLQEGTICRSCGLQHIDQTCPADGKKCHECGKFDHSACQCLTGGRGGNQSRRTWRSSRPGISGQWRPISKLTRSFCLSIETGARDRKCLLQ